jgi:hypothetical protein
MSNRDTFGGSLWKWIVASITTITTLIGGIFWLSNIEHDAHQALAIGLENRIQIEKIQKEQQDTREILLEVRTDLKWLRERLK